MTPGCEPRDFRCGLSLLCFFIITFLVIDQERVTTRVRWPWLGTGPQKSHSCLILPPSTHFSHTFPFFFHSCSWVRLAHLPACEDNGSPVILQLCPPASERPSPFLSWGRLGADWGPCGSWLDCLWPHCQDNRAAWAPTARLLARALCPHSGFRRHARADAPPTVGREVGGRGGSFPAEALLQEGSSQYRDPCSPWSSESHFSTPGA